MLSLTHLITKTLRLIVTAGQFICLVLWLIRHRLQLLCLVCNTCCVTKATPIHFINGKKLKSFTAGLTDHTRSISHHITPLVINALGGQDMHAHTYHLSNKTYFKKQVCTSLQPVSAWLKTLNTHCTHALPYIA